MTEVSFTKEQLLAMMRPDERDEAERVNARIRGGYTGKERRWMTRRLYNWTNRDDQFYAQQCNKEVRLGLVLMRLYEKARKAGRDDEADALWTAWYRTSTQIREYRERVAQECAPWFTFTEAV